MVNLTWNNTAVLFLLRANITTIGVTTALLHRELLTGSKLAIGLAAFHFYYLNRPLKCAWECVWLYQNCALRKVVYLADVWISFHSYGLSACY